MTAAVTDLRGDRESKRLLIISLSVLAVVFVVIAWFTLAYVRALWQGRHDIAVTWDPAPTTERSYRPARSNRIASPEGSRFVASSQSHLVLADAADEEVFADLGDVDEVAWISEDALVGFGQGTFGGFEGLAVVDIGDQSVEQVDIGGRGDGFSPVEVTADGRVTVCALVYDSTSSYAHCTPQHFLLDPATAELTPA